MHVCSAVYYLRAIRSDSNSTIKNTVYRHRQSQALTRPAQNVNVVEYQLSAFRVVKAEGVKLCT